jgi:signal peptide peptidase SppA
MQPWALPEERITEILSAREEAPAREPEVRTSTPAGKRKSIALMKLRGVFEKNSLWGGLDTDRASQVFQGFAQDENVGAIVLQIDSPGGSVFGVEEFADQILEARKGKPVVAVADGLMASAAYWIGASASRLVATPSSLLGSIGVYVLHLDLSKMLEDIGIKPTFIQAGKFKTEGNAYEPLTDAGKEHEQGIVDAYYSTFVKAVAKGRNVSVSTVRSDFGQGRVVIAADAVKVGMADEIGSLEGVLRGLSSKIGVVGAEAVERRRRQFALTKQKLSA